MRGVQRLQLCLCAYTLLRYPKFTHCYSISSILNCFDDNNYIVVCLIVACSALSVDTNTVTEVFSASIQNGVSKLKHIQAENILTSNIAF